MYAPLPDRETRRVVYPRVRPPPLGLGAGPRAACGIGRWPRPDQRLNQLQGLRSAEPTERGTRNNTVNAALDVQRVNTFEAARLARHAAR